MKTPKFEIGDLVEFHSPRNFNDEGIRYLGVITECPKPEDVYYDYQKGDSYSVCYEVFWYQLGHSSSVLEGEIKIPD